MIYLAKLKRFQVMALALIAITCYGLGNAWTLFPAISNLIVGSLPQDISPEQYGLLSAILLIAALISSNFASEYGRNKGMKKTLILSCLVISSAMLLLTLFYKYKFFSIIILSQLFLGCGIGGILTSFSSYLSLLIPTNTALFLTFSVACINFGSFSNPFFLKYFANFTDWKVISTSLCLLFFSLFCIGYFLLKDVRNTSVLNKKKLTQILPSLPLSYWIFGLVIFLYSFCEITFSSWLPMFLHQDRKLSLAASDFNLSVFWGTFGISQLCVILLLLKFKPENIYRLFPFFLLASFIGLELFPTEHLVYFIVLGAIGCSAFFSLTMSFAEKRGIKIAEIASGTVVGGYFLGSGIGTFTIGTLRNKFSIPFSYVFIFLMFVCCALIFLSFYSTSSKLKKIDP